MLNHCLFFLQIDLFLFLHVLINGFKSLNMFISWCGNYVTNHDVSHQAMSRHPFIYAIHCWYLITVPNVRQLSFFKMKVYKRDWIHNLRLQKRDSSHGDWNTIKIWVESKKKSWDDEICNQTFSNSEQAWKIPIHVKKFSTGMIKVKYIYSFTLFSNTYKDGKLYCMQNKNDET